MKKVNVAFLGFGHQAANYHGEYIAENRKDDVSIVGIYDILPDDMAGTQQKIKELGLKIEPKEVIGGNPDSPNNMTGVRQLLDQSKEIDAVIISTPHAKHYEQTKICLENKLHVLVDKPLAHSRQQAEELVGLAEAKKRALVVASQRRYEPVYKRVKQMVQNNNIGNIITASALMSQSSNWLQKGWRLDLNLACGGVAGDIGWHTIDYLCYLLENKKVERVDASLWFKQGIPIEHCATACIRWQGGPDIQLNINQLAPHNAVYERFYLAGDNGMMVIDRNKPKRDSRQPVVTLQKIDSETVKRNFSKAQGQRWAPTKAFLDYVKAHKNKFPNISNYQNDIVSWGKQSIETVSIIEGIYRSAMSGNPEII